MMCLKFGGVRKNLRNQAVKQYMMAAIVFGIALTSIDCHSYLEKSNEVDCFFLER